MIRASMLSSDAVSRAPVARGLTPGSHKRADSGQLNVRDWCLVTVASKCSPPDASQLLAGCGLDPSRPYHYK
jgi:hypothetical protein